MLLLTGANGFVGNGILKAAKHRGLKIRPVYRSLDHVKENNDEGIVCELGCVTDWSATLQGVDVIIHAAARAHIMREDVVDPLAEYRRVNVIGTLNLARQAAAAGVRRFVFLSSIKVNGETTNPGCPFTADDDPAPEDTYGLSKAEAEVLLKEVALETGMELTIIRPPLIYGQGVKGNLAVLISWVRRGIPLPLGGVTDNRRSLVNLDNLVDLILICTDHPKAANQTFLVSDGEDLSTAELLRKIGKALGQEAYLPRLPAKLISFMAGLAGKELILQRLLGSLQADIDKTCELLDWKPPVSVEEGLRKTMK
jgi:nucleoside-diphosphate-sugar epimerase